MGGFSIGSKSQRGAYPGAQTLILRCLHVAQPVLLLEMLGRMRIRNVNVSAGCSSEDGEVGDKDGGESYGAYLGRAPPVAEPKNRP